MAREYARVKVSIWADTDFRKLPRDAQGLYFQLISSPTMSLCGVADWRPNRLAALTAGETAESVRETAQILADSGYIVVDESTEEVLVRTFVKHDGLIKTPNIAAAMVKDYAGTASPLLRGVIVHELLRLHEESPEMSGWSTARQLLTEPDINPSGMPSVNPSGMPLPNPSGNGSDIPQPATINQQPASTRKRATALPDDFEPNDHHRDLALQLRVGLDYELQKFRDYAKSVGWAKKDWDATFNNWIRKAAEMRPNVDQPTVTRGDAWGGVQWSR